MGKWYNDAGGTSLAAPIWAAIVAILNQVSLAQNLPRLGFANPLFYQIKQTELSSKIDSPENKSFRSIIKGHTSTYLKTPNHADKTDTYLTPGFEARDGIWNPAVGLGVPNVSRLIQKILKPVL